eukprot:gene23512-31863_t
MHVHRLSASLRCAIRNNVVPIVPYRHQIHHIAIVGGGPSGFYTAKYLLDRDIKVDLYEKLPTPYGLVRFGVAPDHSDVKSVTSTFLQVANNSNFRFYGNVEVVNTPASNANTLISDDNDNNTASKPQQSAKVSLANLLDRYSAVVLGYGATSDKKLGIPGEENSERVFSAREFVSWYNGHPDCSSNYPIDLEKVENVVIVGQGNVALDCARILTKSVSSLEITDLSTEALKELRKSKIKSVTIIGRRGHAQCAFTIKELRELSKLEHVNTNILSQEVEEGETAATIQELEGIENRPRKRIAELIRKIAGVTTERSQQQDAATETLKNINIRFLLTPTEILTAPTPTVLEAAVSSPSSGLSSPPSGSRRRVTALKVVRNTLTGPAHRQQPQMVEGDESAVEILPCDLLIKSVGYQCEPLDTNEIASLPEGGRIETVLPFDHQLHRVPHIHGRVVGLGPSSQAAPINGLYVVGWLKRGPTGIIGTNINDAKETVGSILQDLGSQQLKDFPDSSYDPFPLPAQRLREDNRHSSSYVTWDEFLKIDAEERRRGQAASPQRERIKILHIDEMLKIAKE